MQYLLHNPSLRKRNDTRKVTYTVTMSRQFTVRVPYISSIHVMRCIPLLPLLSVSPEIRFFHLESDVRFMCPNNLSLLVMATVSGECVGLN